MEKGDAVQFYIPDHGTRTGVYIRTVERGRKFGLLEIMPTLAVPARVVYVKPDNVQPIVTLGGKR